MVFLESSLMDHSSILQSIKFKFLVVFLSAIFPHERPTRHNSLYSRLFSNTDLCLRAVIKLYYIWMHVERQAPLLPLEEKAMQCLSSAQLLLGCKWRGGVVQMKRMRAVSSCWFLQSLNLCSFLYQQHVMGLMYDWHV